MLLRASNEMFVVPRLYKRLGNQMVLNAARASAGVRYDSRIALNHVMERRVINWLVVPTTSTHRTTNNGKALHYYDIIIVTITGGANNSPSPR